MLLVLIAGPMLWENFASLADKPGAWQWVRNGTARISGFSDRMGAQEMQLRGTYGRLSRWRLHSRFAFMVDGSARGS